MGFFKRIFSRKKEEAAEQALQEITEEFFPEQQEDESRRIGHYVLDYCEQIIESAKELGEEKKEYDIVTSYRDLNFTSGGGDGADRGRGGSH